MKSLGNTTKVWGGCIIGSCIVAGGLIIQHRIEPAYIGIGLIRVSGAAEQEVQADIFTMNAEYSASLESVGDAVKATKEAKKRIIEALNNNGLIRDVDYFVYPRSITQTKATDSGKDIITTQQGFKITTRKLAEAEKAVKALEELAADGTAVTCSGRRYEYKDKTQLEKELVAKALIDAYDRATQIARLTGGELLGHPEVSWSWVRLRDKSAAKEAWYGDGGSTKEQVADMSINVEYRVKKTDS
jgi:hypothetical protein